MRSIFLITLSVIFFSKALFAQDAYEELRQSFFKNDITPLFLEKLPAESKEVVELGRMLFYDKILSGNKNISCSTCHHAGQGSVDNLPISLGEGAVGLGHKRQLKSGHMIPRNAPAAFNIGYESFHTTMWDGRIAITKHFGLQTPEPSLNGLSPDEHSLSSQLKTVAAAQAMFPVTSADEMRGQKGTNEIADANSNIEVWKRLTDRLLAIPKYVELFKRAYPNIENINDLNFAYAARAIAAFEAEAFRADKSKLDLFLAGDSSALSRSQFRGAKLFTGKARCVSCHSGAHLTDFKFYSLATPQLGPGKAGDGNEPKGEDRGLALITGNAEDNYKFKTPSLRNVAMTGPWMHSGVYFNLHDVVRHHLNPQLMCLKYAQNPEDYFVDNHLQKFFDYLDLDFSRNKARMNSVDKNLSAIELNEREINDLVQFLKALSDKSFLTRFNIPKSVPSGLPVRD